MARIQKKLQPNEKICHTMQLWGQILSASMIFYFKVLFLNLSKTQETELTTLPHEGLRIHLTMKDFLAWHVMLIQINNRSCNCSKEEHNAG